ncbi:MAG TPA: Calx-beta domain-containing protein, partial [Pyrinomonadaceae bacterium]|nr:Calx-beta domain-containing protein [Pyrinomonadaceae bacterium]
MPRSRKYAPAVCLVAAAAILGLFFLASAGEAAPNAAPAPPDESAAAGQADKTKIGEAYGKLPMSFVANAGQTDGRVKFISRGRGYNLFLTAREAVLVLTRTQQARPRPTPQSAAKPSPSPSPSASPSPQPTPQRTQHVLRMELVGANDNPRVAGANELPGKVNYLIGNDASRWHTNLLTFARVEYEEVYPGIGLVYYGNERQLEYDFVVAPGAKPEAIKLQFDGADDLKVNDRGDLLIGVAGEVVTMHRPFLYQAADDGGRREVQGRYVLRGKGQVVFEVKKFDKGKTLVIDPVIAYATEIGSGGHDNADDIAVDAAGNAYITGSTDSSTFPTTAGSLKPKTNGFGSEAFVTKLNATGTALVYSTFLGGSGSEFGLGVDVDSSGNAYVTGRTDSANFPVLNFLKGPGGNLLKSADGGSVWSDKNVGPPPGSIRVLAVDPLNPNTIYAGGEWGKGGGIYKSVDGGTTWNSLNTGPAKASCPALVIDPKTPSTLYAALTPGDFNGSGIYKSTDGGNTWTSVSEGLNGFHASALAIDPKTPTTLYTGAGFDIYKTTDGGASWKPSSSGITNVGFMDIAVNPVNPAIIYVGTQGGVFKSVNGGASWAPANAGLTSTSVRSLEINPATPSTIYASTWQGGVFKSSNSGASWAAVNNGLPASVEADALAMAPAAPATLYLGTSNGRVYKTTTAGASWSKVYETLSTTSINALAVDPSAAAKVYAGASPRPEFTLNRDDAFVSKLNANGSALVYSTYLGGEGEDYGNGIAVDGGGSAYVTGATTSPDFMLANAYQASLKGGADVFVTKFTPAGKLAYSTYIGGQYYDVGNDIAVDSSGYAYVAGTASSDDFPSVNAIPGKANGAFVTKVGQTGKGLVYSTRLGADEGQGVAVDASGSAYVTGIADWTFQATPGAFQTELGGNWDAYLAKINPAGGELVYATFLGGQLSDRGSDVALDSSGNAYVIGDSNSDDYPIAAGAVRTRSPLYKSTNSGASWENTNLGLRGDVVQSLAIDPQNPGTLYAGTNTGGVFKSTDGGDSWKQVKTGQVAAIVVDPASPSTVYSAHIWEGVFKSTDGGESWAEINSGLPSSPYVVSLAIDPVTPSTLYLGTSGGPVYKSVNGGATWRQSSSPATLNNVVSFSISPAQPATVYAAANMSSAGIFKSTNAGATWSRLAAAQLGLGESVAVSPADAAVVFASAGNALYKSVNGGASWSRAHTSGGKVVFDPADPSTVYLLTGEGLFKSADGGANWRAINKGFRHAGATALAVHPTRPSTVYAGGYSGGHQQDVFVTKVNQTGGALVYSTFLGPGYGRGVTVDARSNAYAAGVAYSDFPMTPNSYQPFNIQYEDAFVAKLGPSYDIRGQALNADGSPLGGVEVTLGGAQLRSVVTGSDGGYAFKSLPGGASFTVSAARASYSFTPAAQSFASLNGDKTVNFKAAASSSPFYTISGRVTNNGSALGGVEVKLGGSQTRVAATDAAGNYSFTLPGGGGYTVTPAVLGFSFTPASKTFSALGANQTADFAAGRVNFVVTNTNDHGAGSLWQAVTDANATPGADTITFKIPGTGVKTIATRVALPDITETVTIDATTQPGFAGAPIVVLDGSRTHAGSGLRLLANNCTIRGLVIHSFDEDGIRVEGSGNTIQGNYVGTDATGKQPRPNHAGIGLYNSSNNTIGGTTAAARNVISGNNFEGISVANAWDNLIQGNFIGTDAAGTAPLGNGTYGISVWRSVGGNPPAGNLIGGTVPGAGNLISGNQTGVDIGQPGTTIQGNLVGTDLTGTKKVGNSVGIRITITVSPADTLVGGTAPGARNVISGNGSEGIYIQGEGSVLQGNFVGTDITGLAALGNGGTGVVAGDKALVGGTTPEARNIISGNGGYGNVALGYNGPGNVATVQGNYIGTDLTGNVALANPAAGVSVFSLDNVIGGPTPGARNVISGNRVGIQLGGYTTAIVTGNVIQGNYLGLNATGSAPLPNTSAGIVLSDASDNVIGGAVDAAGNVIAFSGGAGVVGSSGAGNLISRNRIFSNAKLGIELGADGVTPNDAGDLDQGGNGLQNFPVLTSVTSNSTSTTVKGSLKSRPSTSFTIDFYSNGACDASGSGEGARFFNSKKVVTDAKGNAVIDVVIPKPLPAGRTITATATDPEGSTSEFSPCDQTAAAGSVEFSGAVFNVLEDVGSATVTVVRSGGSKGPLTVKYATANLTATAGSDYTAAAGTLVFAEGETSKTFKVAIANDGVTEPDESLRLTLSGLPDLEMMGAYGTAVMNIKGNNTPLALFGDDVSVVEGDAGTKDAAVTVSLSAATGRTVTVSYVTSPGFYDGTVAAESGTDFHPVSGTLTFGPGVTSQTLTVPVVGDTVDELTESFALLLTPTSNVTVFNSPVVYIKDDEPDPRVSIADATAAEGNPGEQTNISFTVQLSRASAFYVRLRFSLGGGTATWEDYPVYAGGGLTFEPGQTSQTITLPVFGDSVDEPNETFFVLLSDPSNATLEDGQATGTIVDNDPTTVSIADVTMTEGNAGSANAAFKVSLSTASAQTVTVKYATSNGTATSPADYAPASGTLTFAPGQTVVTLNVPVTGDLADEEYETFAVKLSTPTNAVLGFKSTGACTITDNDLPPKISINSVTVTEGNAGSVNAAFTVSLSAASGLNVSAYYETANGTATAPADYTPGSGWLSFSPGQTSKTVNVVVQSDKADEPDAETFKVLLSTPHNTTIGTGQGVGTITDDDPKPSFSVSDTAVTENDGGTTTAAFNVSLSAASAQNVTVKFATSNGTATAPADYTAKALTTLTFAPGETSKSVVVYVRGDTLDEANETFNLTLSSATNATIADAVGVGTITDNDPAAAAQAAKTEPSASDQAATSTVEFAEAVYVVSEGDGRLEVTVRRAGDLSSPLAVEYATADAG